MTERRPQCRREEAPVPPREAPVPRGGPLCRKVFCPERILGGPCAGRRLLCREEPVLVGPVLCAERIEGGPVPPRGGPCVAERRPLCREEVLCRKVFCAERVGGGPCVGRRLSMPNGPTPLWWGD